MDAFWYYSRQMFKYKGRFFVGMVCAIISSVAFGGGLALVLPILRVLFKENAGTFREYVEGLNENSWVGVLIPDGVVELMPTSAMGGLYTLVGLLICTTVIGGYTRYIHAYYSMTVSILTVADIRTRIFARMMKLPLLTIIREPVSDKVSRIMRDSNQLGRGMTALVSKTLAQVLRGFTALIVAFLANWLVALLALLLVPVLALSTRWFGKQVRRTSKKSLAQNAKLIGTTTQSLHGIRVVKVHTAERVETGRLRRVNKDIINAEFPLRNWKAMGAPTIESLAMIGFSGLIVYAGSQILDGRFEAATVAQSLIALGMALTTMKPLIYLWNELNEAAAAADRLREMEDLQSEETRESRAIRKPSLPTFARELVFDNVSFQYPTAEQPAVDGVSLTVPKGKTYAFVGPNGCGKTTLLSLIPRLFDPTAGRITIDGRDVREVSLRSLRNQIGVVTQDTVMFIDTIAQNIAYGSLGATREAIEEAARRAYADGFIQKKPQGYNTMVGERGGTLSGGERQRLAIARVILRDPEIIILDEATSMIDADSEALIAEALDEFCHGRTSLVIAHRLSTVVNADQIVVMDSGRVLDVGTHTELLARCALYQQLCRTQLLSSDTDSDNGGSDDDAAVGGASDGPGGVATAGTVPLGTGGGSGSKPAQTEPAATS